MYKSKKWGQTREWERGDQQNNKLDLLSALDRSQVISSIKAQTSEAHLAVDELVVGFMFVFLNKLLYPFSGIPVWIPTDKIPFNSPQANFWKFDLKLALLGLGENAKFTS